MSASATITLSSFEVLGPRARVLVAAPSLSLRPGHLTAIIGPNGAGKTSLLRGLSGVLATRGEARLGQMPISALTPLQRSRAIAYQPQGVSRPEGLTVAEFVESARGGSASWLSGIGEQDSRAVSVALERAGIAGLRARSLDALSGGEFARVLLASTLALESGWLLLDEPVAAADVRAAREVYRLLRSMVSESGLSIAVVEHDLGLARSFADDAVLVADGRVLAHGPVASVLSASEMKLAYGTAFVQAEVVAGAWAVVADESRNSQPKPAISQQGGAP